MHTGRKRRVKNLGFLSLVGTLAAGVLVDIALSPGTILKDIPEVAFPLGILSGFLLFAFLMRSHSDGHQFRKRVGQFGWIGAIVGGILGIWLATRQLSIGIPFIQAYDEVLTALDIGIATGALVGVSIATTHQHDSQQDDDRERVLVESTWTNRPEPDPILVEIVEQIAELEGIGQLEMEPLYTHINPDVFEDIRDGSTGPWQVLFYTDKYEIRVNSQGTVTVYDIRRPDREPVMAPTAQSMLWP